MTWIALIFMDRVDELLLDHANGSDDAVMSGGKVNEDRNVAAAIQIMSNVIFRLLTPFWRTTVQVAYASMQWICACCPS